jgi:periplasmic divalent cation tolerance protein
MPTAFVTAPPDASETIAAALVEERLAACVNSVDCESRYWWDGEVQTDDEVILLAKTTDDRYPALVERIREIHPYDVPCIERFDEADELDAFGQWRTGSVRE